MSRGYLRKLRRWARFTISLPMASASQRSCAARVGTFPWFFASGFYEVLRDRLPMRVIAVNHDTSVAMLERTYSRYIADHADALARRALLDTSATQTDNMGYGSTS